MNKKEEVYIFYDKGIKARISSGNNSYISSSTWQDVLMSLLRKRKFSKKKTDNCFVIEYEDITIKISDLTQVLKSPVVKKFITKTYVSQQEDRIQSINNYNQNVLRNKERSQTSNTEYKNSNITNSKTLKVKRKNKYSKILKPVVMGTLTLATLATISWMTANSQTKEEFNEQPDITNIQSEIVSVEESVSDNFEIGLDINDVFTPNNNFTESAAVLSYENYSNESRVIQTKNKYGSLIEKYSKKCGVDPRIILGIAVQESADHELGLRSGSKGGLMQIEISYWRNKEITYYDFDDKKDYVIKITDENIKDIDNNILVGCAILQNELKLYNYNILLAIQSYNMGYGNINKILGETSAKTGLTKMQIINDNNNLDWVEYTDVVNQGDPDYLKKVLSWTGYGYDFYEFTCKNENGDIKTCSTLPVDVTHSKAM